MKIYLSNQGNLRNFQRFVRELDFTHPGFLEITTHSKWVTVHPANLVLAAALALKVGKEHARMVGDVPDSGMYLDRMGLYDFLATDSPFDYTKKEESGKFVPLRIIKTATEQSQFIADIVPLLHLNEKDASTVKYVVGELVRNVLEHAYSPDGAIVAAQYYKKTNRVSLGICDNGIGIQRSMMDFWHPRTDLDAIHLALTPGISGTSGHEGGSSENAGAGLFFTKSIAKTTRNYFVMYSGSAEYTLLKYRTDLLGPPKLYADPKVDRHSEAGDLPYFQGTLVAVDISLDNTSEFKNLMAEINAVYSQAIRERKKVKYREPKLI